MFVIWSLYGRVLAGATIFKGDKLPFFITLSRAQVNQDVKLVDYVLRLQSPIIFLDNINLS